MVQVPQQGVSDGWSGSQFVPLPLSAPSLWASSGKTDMSAHQLSGQGFLT